MSTVHPNDVRNSIGQFMLADGMDHVIDLEKSHGSWLVDARDGKEYLDLFSMFASMSVGYNHPYLLENKDRLTSAALNKPTNSDVYSSQMAAFVDKMGRLAQPNYLPYAFYVEGGALAVENALKTAFDWKVRKNLAAGKPAGTGKIIHFKECFHGRSGYTMSLTDSPDPRKVQYFPKFDWPRIDTPKITFPLTDEGLADLKRVEERAVIKIQEAVENNPGDIAGLIIITGKMWAHEHYGEYCRPDIISFGKKTQVCGIFAGTRLDEVEGHVFKESSRINSTWGGNLVDMVRFTIYLEIISQENLIDKAAENGAYLKQKLETLQRKNSDKVSNVRNRGLFGAFDMRSTEERDKMIGLISEEGALMLGCGHTSIRFRPHLNITQDEIDQGISMIESAISKL